MLDAPLLTARERSSVPVLRAEGAAVPAVEVELVADEEDEGRPDLDLFASEERRRVGQEAVAAVAAEHVEADSTLAGLVEDHVDDPSQLDAVQDDALVEKLDPGHCSVILPGPRDVKTQRIAKPSSPCASGQVTSTSSTRAPRGPRRHQPTIDSTRSSSPSKTASTEPSGALRTHPARPSERARSRASALKKTPCTNPRTTTSARFTV